MPFFNLQGLLKKYCVSNVLLPELQSLCSYAQKLFGKAHMTLKNPVSISSEHSWYSDLMSSVLYLVFVLLGISCFVFTAQIGVISCAIAIVCFSRLKQLKHQQTIDPLQLLCTLIYLYLVPVVVTITLTIQGG